MHKKQASLIPLNYEYQFSSEQEESIGEERINGIFQTPSPSAVLSRKLPGRAQSPGPVPCSCNSTAVPSRAGSGALTALQVGEVLPMSKPAAPAITTEVSFSVDGHRATVTLENDELRINYVRAKGCCCVPPQRTETIPLSEVLSAQTLPPVVSKWLWRPFTRLTHRLAIYTFSRSPRNPSHWVPRQLTLATPSEGITQHWAALVNAAAAAKLRRPRHLLVLVNPFGGKRAAEKIFASEVGPVFEKAGIKTAVRHTKYAGHARGLLLEMPPGELSSFDGVVAVGGDGLFHEIVNALLTLRTRAVKRTTTEAGGDALGAPQQQPSSPAAVSAAATAAASLRVGHVPAGSTDAVACTLNGTRSPFSAAMRIALGDGVPLDVLRIDAADGSTEFATCMASYGFMGDVMTESERLRWLGPMRYDLVGAKILASNRSYHARVSYLPAEQNHPGSFTRVCSSRCMLCTRPPPSPPQLQPGGGGSPSSNMGAAAAAAASSARRSPFARHSRLSLRDRQREWVSVEDDFAGIMLVIMPCRSSKSLAGVAKYGHLSDGNIHLVMVRKCSRLQYLRFLIRLSSSGLEAGKMGDYVQVVPATAVRVEPGGAAESTWNIDGEVLRCAAVTAETHRGAIEVFARGVECDDDN